MRCLQTSALRSPALPHWVSWSLVHWFSSRPVCVLAINVRASQGALGCTYRLIVLGRCEIVHTQYISVALYLHGLVRFLF